MKSTKKLSAVRDSVSVAQSRGWCTLSGVAHQLRKPFCALLQLAGRTTARPDRASAANRLPFASTLPRFCIVAPFHLFISCLLSFTFSDLDVHKYLSGLFLVSPNQAAGYRVKSESFLDFFLLLHV